MKEKLKILFISRGCPDENFPLNGIFEFDQAKALAACGHEVFFAALDFSRKSKGTLGLSVFSKNGVKVYRFFMPSGVYRRALPLLRMVLDYVYKHIISDCGKPDIVHVHFYFMGAIGSILKTKYGLPILHTEHSSKLNKPANEISDLDKKLARMAFSAADMVISVSKALSLRLEENFGVKSRVIPNIVDDHAFVYRERRKDKAVFDFVSVGRLVPIKNFDKLIPAFAKADLGEKARLNIIGDGPERNNLEKMVVATGLKDKVLFHGAATRDKIAEKFYDSDAFILLSEKETFGVSMVEAMYTGLPVISSRCGGPEDFITPDNGILLPDREIETAAKAMRKMVLGERRFNPAKIAAGSKESFSARTVSGQITEAYRQCIDICRHT